nr:MAG TPA: hypothetical protein [Caudoviricetes sp.]
MLKYFSFTLISTKASTFAGNYVFLRFLSVNRNSKMVKKGQYLHRRCPSFSL